MRTVLLVVLLGLISARPAFAEVLCRAKTHIVGGSVAEIGAYAPARKVLIATNDADEMIDLYRVKDLAGHATLDGVQRIDVEDTEPSSVAVHPTRPLAFVVALCGGHTYPGELYVLELEGPPGKASGRQVHRQALPPGPDCIAIAPDGRTALVAIEAEENPKTPGRVLAIDLTKLNHCLAGKGKLPVHEITGLDEALGIPVGRIEPEFISISDDSRLAAVSCQENDAVVLIDLPTRTITGVIRLKPCSDPDGVAITGPTTHNGRKGYLIVAAEEGRKHPKTNVRGGQALSVHFVPADAPGSPLPLGSLDVRKPLHALPGERCDPEGVVLFQLGGKLYCTVGLERKQKALLVDLSDPTNPRCVHVIDVGVRPEGLFAIPLGPNHVCCVVVNEGNGENGSITFVDLRENQP